MYLDQRSTVLAVDNLNGAKVGGRTLRVRPTRRRVVASDLAAFSDYGNTA